MFGKTHRHYLKRMGRQFRFAKLQVMLGQLEQPDSGHVFIQAQGPGKHLLMPNPKILRQH